MISLATQVARQFTASSPSGKAQGTSDRDGKMTGDAQMVILLQTGDRLRDIAREDAVYRPTIVAVTSQCDLQCADVSGILHELFAGLVVVEQTPRFAPCEIRLVDQLALVQTPVLVALRERIAESPPP